MTDKRVKTTLEEEAFLHHMTTEMLTFFSELKSHKLFYTLKDFFTLFVDQRKNVFFDNTALKFTEKQLVKEHTYKLGEVNAVKILVRLIAASDQELIRRRNEYEKRKQEIKEK